MCFRLNVSMNVRMHFTVCVPVNIYVYIYICLNAFVCLTWIVFVMGGKWPYSCCFVGCCLQDLFNIARSILV